MKRLFHERRVYLIALLGGLPGLIAALLLLWVGGYSSKVIWTVAILVGGVLLACASSVRERVVNPLRTIANLLEAMREGDYSIRARHARGGDALGEVMQQVNVIGATLRAQRLGALEATALLRKVMEEIDVAVFTFDTERRLKFVNRAGERLLNIPAERALDRDLESLGLAAVLGARGAAVDHAFPGASGRWSVSRTSFREEGKPLELLVLSDVSRALREEELAAWQRIVRVLGHELNNSLAPIKSLAGSMSATLREEPLPPDWRDDLRRGLAIIESRSDGLARFLAAYAQLARLPAPSKSRFALRPLVAHVAHLETRAPVEAYGDDVAIVADAAQIEQALINLVRNAVDAGPPVRVVWRTLPGLIEIRVTDHGPGVAGATNLFVPFFTTKPGGTGIGLALARQIAEAHGGSLTLADRGTGPGAEAKLLLPFG
ncbi:MAG: ATP-binding protein [Bryobacteraceae bacterium]|nr:ATP-binding protein [Bryobacteraceae bacterium]